MLKGIDQKLSADVVFALMQMGHGDNLLICDVNHPAAAIAQSTVTGRVLDMAGCDIIEATHAILSLMPLDTFIPAPVQRMQIVGDSQAELPIFARMQTTVDAYRDAGLARPVQIDALERFAFYAAAKQAFCVIRTSDSGPYGCFLLTKGVVNLPPLRNNTQ
mgnify:CR=1 FL=1